MPYRSTDKTRQKKDAKRTAMMQAAVRVFAEKGYHAATVRDIVQAADVAIGTFYFYFPDKETLFVHLYEETALFLLQAIQQATARFASGKKAAASNQYTLPRQIEAAIQAYVNIAIYEPAIVQLLLIGGLGSPALFEKRTEFRERLIRIWQQALEEAEGQQQLAPQDIRRSAEALTGAVDEVILHLLSSPNRVEEAGAAVRDLTTFALRAIAYQSRP
jgi:AcrR family transcriptional regulator